MAGQRLVDRIVRDLEHHVVEARPVVGVADVHSGPLAHRVEALEDLDALGVVIALIRGIAVGVGCHSPDIGIGGEKSRARTRVRARIQRGPNLPRADGEARGAADAVEQSGFGRRSSTPGRGLRADRTAPRGASDRGGRRPRRAAGSAARRARSATSSAWARTRPSRSAFCSPVELRAAGMSLAVWVTARSCRWGPSERAAGGRVAGAAGAKLSGEIAAVPALERDGRRGRTRRRARSPAARRARRRYARGPRRVRRHARPFALRARPASLRRDHPRRAACSWPASRLRSARCGAAWLGSSARTSRSRKRRRSPAAPVNSRSIAGVTQSTDSHSPSELTDAGAPLIRTWRRSGALGERAGADVGLAEPRRDREGAVAALPRHLGQRARREGRARARAATRPRAHWSCPRHSRR